MFLSRVRPVMVMALAGLLFLGGCADFFTGGADTGRTNWAVVVGISNYQNTAFNLNWADEDALDFYDALRRGKNWEADKIILLTNSSATREGIKSAIAGLAKRVGADDQVLFYFSGRGTYGPDQPPFDEGDGLDEYLVPFDALPNSTARDLSDDELETLFSALPTNNVLIVLETGFTCSSARGGLPGKEKCLVRAGGNRSIAPRGMDGMGHDLARPGYVFMAAAQGGDASFESNALRNGVFTAYLVEGMRGAANPGKKLITAQQAFEYAAPRARASTTGQTPQLLDNRGQIFRLSSL